MQKEFLKKARARALYDFRVVDTRAKTLPRANNKPQEAQVILPWFGPYRFIRAVSKSRAL